MRYQYGGDGGSVVTDAAGNAVVGRPGTVWTARTGGSQVTDLLDMAGGPTGGTITTDSRGRLLWQGPDAVTSALWWDPGDGGPRWAVTPTEVDRVARQQVDTYAVPLSVVGEASGVAELDGGGHVPAAQLPDLSASYVPRPAGGQAGDALVRGSDNSVFWARLDTATVSPWEALESMPGPRWIAHRGGSLLAPENSIEAMRMAVELNADAIEMDVYKVADGGLFVMHDATVDRTTNLTGSQATALTVPAALRGRIGAGTWFANTWPSDLRIPLFADVLADIGNTVPLIVHCNNAGSGALAVAEIQRQELSEAVLIMAWNETELADARAAGIPSCLLDADGVLSGQTYAGLIAAGTTYLGVDYSQATNAAINAAAAAGLRVLVYTVNRRTHFAALPTTGSVWGVISDDPWYTRGTTPMRTADLFGAGTFFHGMPTITDSGDYRGGFQTGSPNWFVQDASGTLLSANSGYTSTLQGYLGPLNAFTLDTDFVIDVADYATASMQIMLSVGDKEFDDQGGGAANPNGYNILVRSNGTIDVYKLTGGTPTSVGTVATAAITAGTTQHLKVQVTATQLIITRTNIAAPNSVTVTDSTYRGGMYPHLGVRDTKTRWANLTIT
ncbi:glycerophosphodiester phosphodiesterase [Streptomyces peucetius]|uniref:glycerophosphodiester phosphodiesterase n=1 Tax=Streptomyces peucetius TaxID=1950 RepID=UPI0004CDD329|nr:glycerophosphodiester phosphodiesterase family protein [Streptomyces peucetius]